MSVSGVGGGGAGRWVDDSQAPRESAPAPAGAAPAARAAAEPPPVEPGSLKRVYDTWERFLNRTSALFGKDRELDQLSSKVVKAKERAFADRVLTRKELDEIQSLQGLIGKAYVEAAARRGYPPGVPVQTRADAFRVYGEDKEIHFQWLAGQDLRGGAAGELTKALRKGERGASVDALAKKIAFDLVTSPSEAIAADKVHLLRAQLAQVPDRALQEDAFARIAAALDETQRALGVPGAISRAAFEKAARFDSVAAVHETPLPPEIRGTNKLLPNRPIPGWEATTRAAVKASLDDMSAAGTLFLDKVPPGTTPKTVALKIDANLGADGPPSVTDPTATGATIAELLDRSKKQGKAIRFTVGDSAGGENIFLGRTSMDIIRDTGNYHHALKAGLAHAARADGSAAARAALAKVEDAERSGVYFGSKDDKVSTPADRKAAEEAASKYVTVVDYDKAGYTSIDPKLGPAGLAAWGTREFRVAKPWVEADYRIHVTRGVSTHFLAGFTGPTKGLIGLHEFGLRPADQGANKRGLDPLGMFSALSGAQGFGAVIGGRTGLGDIGAKILSAGDEGLKADWRACQSKWDALRASGRAFSIYEKGVADLAAELRRDRDRGMSEPALFDKMRTRTREVLERADEASPGFKQALWDAAHETTRVAMVAGRNLRGLVPKEIRDEDLGARIGLLTSLPYPSDLVIATQPKIGEGGGPDAYHTVRDVGAIVAATDEATADAVAWRRAGRTDSVWETNYPVDAALRYGRGPMHLDEVRDVTRPR